MKNQQHNNSEFFIKNPDPEEKRLADVLIVDVITADPFGFVNGVLMTS